MVTQPLTGLETVYIDAVNPTTSQPGALLYPIPVGKLSTINSTANALTALGTNRATSLAILGNSILHVFSTVAAGTGVTLPAGVVGMHMIIFNAGASVLQVYGNGSDTIDTVAGATGVPLTNAHRCHYWCVAANTWISAQLGVVSA